MTWDGTMSVRIGALDVQHREMVDLLNELHDAVLAQADRSTMRGLLQRLLRHCIEHFESEERLFDQYEYPGRVAHKGKHDEMCEQVQTVVREFEAGKPVLTETLVKFLQTWLDHHIKGSDRLYASYLNRKGVF